MCCFAIPDLILLHCSDPLALKRFIIQLHRTINAHAGSIYQSICNNDDRSRFLMDRTILISYTLLENLSHRLNATLCIRLHCIYLESFFYLRFSENRLIRCIFIQNESLLCSCYVRKIVNP